MSLAYSSKTSSSRNRSGRGWLPAAVLCVLGHLPGAVGADPAYALQVLHSFASNRPTRLLTAPDGTFIGAAHGILPSFVGRVFRATARGTVSTLVPFEGDMGSDPVGLTVGHDGSIYGATQFGSTTSGSLYRISPDGTFLELHRFNGPDGARPSGNLLQASDGYVYGTTSAGGSGGVGTLFKVNATGSEFSTLFGFSPPVGEQPLGGLIEMEPGILYGTTSAGGTEAGGTIFKVTPSGQLETLVHLTKETGYGWVFLTKTRNGRIVGTAQHGLSLGNGTFFQLTEDDQLTVVANFNEPNGAFPGGGVIEGADGAFYGVTARGGRKDQGTVFRVDMTGQITTLASFDGPSGSGPRGLVEGADGQLYGIAYSGGQFGNGTFFRVVKPPQLNATRAPDGAVVVRWDSSPGIDYRLEFIPDWDGAAWQPIAELTASSETLAVTNRYLGARMGFFRLRILP